MTGFFDRMLGRSGKEGSGAIARNRLEVVLVHDRIELSPERLRELKQELLAVLARYVPIDPDSVDIAVEQPDRRSNRLVAQIAFGKGKAQDFSSTDESYTEDDDLQRSMEILSASEDDSDDIPFSESGSSDESADTGGDTGDSGASDI